MTLNKDLCIKCRKHRTWWNKHDEVRWAKGNVVCVVKNGEGNIEQIVSGTKHPPKHCLFALEHVVSVQPKKEKSYARANRAARANA
jgi:hypothetical protein